MEYDWAASPFMKLMHFIKVSNHIHPHLVLSKTKVSVKCNNYNLVLSIVTFFRVYIIIGGAIQFKDIDNIVYLYYIK
jgi:hypothetical protein